MTKQQSIYRDSRGYQNHLSDLKLVFVGTANWDIYANSEGKLWAIPKPNSCPSVKSSWFGDKHHILKLMRQGYFSDEITDLGLELMNGLHTRLLPKGNTLLCF